MIVAALQRFESSLIRAAISQASVMGLAQHLQHEIDVVRHAFADLGSYTPEENTARKEACRLLHPYLKQSPFLRRALEKPLGYAGDYEMMNMLYRDAEEGETSLGKALNVCFTNEPAAVANKNRIKYLGDLIWDKYERVGAPPLRIASIGCGPAKEIEVVFRDRLGAFSGLDVTLVDQELRALEQCERTLPTWVKLRRAGLRDLLAARWSSEKYDLIYSAGMFDYLDDRVFKKVIASLYNCLAPGGELVIGNVAKHNPSRWIMEYFADWCLIHRTSGDLFACTRDLNASAWVDSEPSGINLFLHVRK